MDNNMENMIGKRLDGRYELIELIGAGGMADIYKAKDITEDKTVAVKILKNEFSGSEDFLRRFRNESKAIALLSHPNIVKIYDVGFNEQLQYIVMEYIDGISLADYIKNQGVLKWKDAVYFTVQILRALQHAHDRGIVHRDIKSQNVMMLADGTIKVMDFGIARFNRETDKTMSEKAIGSVHYISPEQARGEMTDEKSDIYSVGIMLYEMLTGQKPFDGDTPVAIALHHMQTTPQKPREINTSIPEGLEEITLKAMQKEPSMRYQTAGEMINDIEEFKKDPSIVFEYKYLTNDDTTKYFDKVPAQEKPEEEEAAEGEEEDLYDEDEFDEEEVEERRSPLLPIMLAVASVFVIMAAWLIFTIVSQNIPVSNTSNTDEFIMPNLLGMTLEEVQNVYPDIYDNLEVTNKYSTEYPAGEIMEQDVAANRTLKNTSVIKIIVSDGPKKIEIDDFSNLTLEDVKKKLTKAGLIPKVVKIENDEIQEGYVIKTDPPARSTVDEGSEVKVFVSMGKVETPVNVPKFVGMTKEEAEKLAEEKKLTLKIVMAPSNEHEEGIVMEQSIPENSIVNQGDEVEITVCDGNSITLESELLIEIPKSAKNSGTFIFKFYEDGVQIYEQSRDMAINAGKSFTYKVSGSTVKSYIIQIVNEKDEELKGILAEIEVDFTKDPPEQKVIEENYKLFEELIYVPETTPPPPETTTKAPETTPTPTTPPASETTPTPSTPPASETTPVTDTPIPTTDESSDSDEPAPVSEQNEE